MSDVYVHVDDINALRCSLIGLRNGSIVIGDKRLTRRLMSKAEELLVELERESMILGYLADTAKAVERKADEAADNREIGRGE